MRNLAQWAIESSDVAKTHATLTELRRLIGNAEGGGTDRRRAYFEAIDYAEIQLAVCFSLPFESGDWIECFHSPRYWEIQRTRLASDQPQLQLNAEFGALQRQIDQALRALSPAVDQEAVGVPGAVRLVLDTNIHLHFQQFWDVKWKSIVGHSSVRVVVPMAVVKELDNKKNSGGKLAARASGKLKKLRELLADGRGPVQVRDGVTVEVPHGFDRLDSTNADEAILATACALTSRSQGGLLVVTGDYSMELRARALDLAVLPLDDEYRLPPMNEP